MLYSGLPQPQVHNHNSQGHIHYLANKGSPNGMTRMLSMALIRWQVSKMVTVTLELRWREKEMVSST